MHDYRTRIYNKYSSIFKNSKPIFDEKAAVLWGKGYDYYLRGNLPDRKDAIIVDLACGSGKLLCFFKQREYTNITGVDISPEQVQIARQVVPNIIEANVLEFLGEHHETFDLITGFDIIEHFQKDEVLSFLDGCYTALKPHGRLILQTPNAENLYGASIRYGDFSHEVCFTPNALIRLIGLCGFDRIEVRETGPVPWGYSIKSSIRYSMWQIIRCLLKLYNLVETGGTGSGIFTRVFIITAEKQD